MSSWRDLLRQIISNPIERDRIANETGIRPITLVRWVNGESNPRSRNLHQVLNALTGDQQIMFAKLLEDEGIDVQNVLTNPTAADEIEYTFIKQIFEMRATTPEKLLFWTLCRKVFEHALELLDPEHLGMAIRVVQCVPPPHNDKVHSLRESVGLGTSPWQRDLEQEATFLGAESLAGYAVTECRLQMIQDLKNNVELIPSYPGEYELSAVAVPILYVNHVAGCLLVSSTQPNHFASPTRLSLIRDYAQLTALAFKQEQFYAPEMIELRVMPPPAVQRTYLVSFRQRVVALMKQTYATAHPLSRTEAEQVIWQQVEEELIGLTRAQESSANSTDS